MAVAGLCHNTYILCSHMASTVHMGMVRAKVGCVCACFWLLLWWWGGGMRALAGCVPVLGDSLEGK